MKDKLKWIVGAMVAGIVLGFAAILSMLRGIRKRPEPSTAKDASAEVEARRVAAADDELAGRVSKVEGAMSGSIDEQAERLADIINDRDDG